MLAATTYDAGMTASICRSSAPGASLWSAFPWPDACLGENHDGKYAKRKAVHIHNITGLSTGGFLPFWLSRMYGPTNPAHSRALRRHLKAERGAAPAPSCLASTGPERLGDPPWGKTTPRDPSLPAEGHDQRQCWNRAVRRECDLAGRPTPCGAPRGAAFPSPRAKGTRTSAVKPRRRAPKYPKRQSALRPLGLPRGVKTRRQGGKHDGQPRGRATPRTISHGCMTL